MAIVRERKRWLGAAQPDRWHFWCMGSCHRGKCDELTRKEEERSTALLSLVGTLPPCTGANLTARAKAARTKAPCLILATMKPCWPWFLTLEKPFAFKKFFKRLKMFAIKYQGCKEQTYRHILNRSVGKSSSSIFPFPLFFFSFSSPTHSSSLPIQDNWSTWSRFIPCQRQHFGTGKFPSNSGSPVKCCLIGN